MIPSLRIEDSLKPDHRAYLDALRAGGFTGDICTDYATRLVAATDNSVYQIVPQAVICPRTQSDLILAARLLNDERFHTVSLSARGGGTGTDGSALNDGVIVDVSRHMTRILEINVEERWARVQPGVTLAQLNAAVRSHGLFFAPNVAPGDRATLGGMVSTDAAGEGSRVHGKTSSHILELTSIFLGGIQWTSSALTEDELEHVKQRGDLLGTAHREVDRIVKRDKALIERTVPKLWRFASGYNLGMIRGVDAERPFNLNWLLSGAEGTLGLVSEAKLKLTPLPRVHVMVVMKYASFDEALGAAETTAAFKPRAIETMDEKLLDLARTDESWLLVRDFLDDPTVAMRAVNMVEFAGDSLEEVMSHATALTERAAAHIGRADEATGWCIVVDAPHREAMWNLRKRAVGLLGNLPGRRKPIPFIEDAAVPPENLRAFVREMRAVLDRHNLDYGIFGHVDVGCMHVRPALDMTDPDDEALLRPVTDEVAAIVRKCGGILWGEHGKGFRSEYNPVFFGNELYETMRQIKTAFDPRNQFNPGKIATAVVDTARANPRVVSLATIDAVSRGSYDRQIATEIRDHFDDAMRCNGNGQCYSDDPNYVMCPSWKGMRDRVHSPKGRSTVFREWLRLLGRSGFNLSETIKTPSRGRQRRGSDPDDFSHEVYDAMDGCLACKACSGQCPIKVDVPDFRAAFLNAYHTRYGRPARDRMIGNLERMLPRMARAPRLVNALQQSVIGRAVSKRIGMIDAPLLATTTLRQLMRKHEIPEFRDATARQLDTDTLQRTVVIVQDAFTTFYMPQLVIAWCELLRALGYAPSILPYQPGGKGLHVRGYLQEFREAAVKQTALLRHAASFGVSLVGIDPAVTLMYRHEYHKAIGSHDLGFTVELPQEWLAHRLGDLQIPRRVSTMLPMRLLIHCTERALTPESGEQWRRVFAAFGLELLPISAGCCGMGGAWGHEAHHAEHSRGIYDLSWSKRLQEIAAGGAVPLATGYSCMSQVKRFGNRSVQHPVELLRDAVCRQAATV